VNPSSDVINKYQLRQRFHISTAPEGSGDVDDKVLYSRILLLLALGVLQRFDCSMVSICSRLEKLKLSWS
jgi:hypothetical protein